MMNKLIETISMVTGQPVNRIKGTKRYNREVSYAKMIFCELAFEKYHRMHYDIAKFLECPGPNVYYLLASAKRNLQYDKVFQELFWEAEKNMTEDDAIKK